MTAAAIRVEAEGHGDGAEVGGLPACGADAAAHGRWRRRSLVAGSEAGRESGRRRPGPVRGADERRRPQSMEMSAALRLTGRRLTGWRLTGWRRGRGSTLLLALSLLAGLPPPPASGAPQAAAAPGRASSAAAAGPAGSDPGTGPRAGSAGGNPATGATAPFRASLNDLQESGQRFQPLWSAGGVVASQEHQASAAGVALLRQGGNAVDAAVATAFALAVTLPQAGNLGGGGFAVVWLPGASGAAARGCLSPQAAAAPSAPAAAAARRHSLPTEPGQGDPPGARPAGRTPQTAAERAPQGPAMGPGLAGSAQPAAAEAPAMAPSARRGPGRQPSGSPEPGAATAPGRANTGMPGGPWPAAAAAVQPSARTGPDGRSRDARAAGASAVAAQAATAATDATPELILGGGHAVAVNFRETAPAATGPDLFRRPDGSVDRGAATRSLRATAVPGSVAGLVLLQHCYGRLPLRRVMAPAIGLAERGVRVDRELADSLAAAQPLLQADPSSAALFLRPGPAGGLRPLQPGEVLRQPRLAATLRRIADQGSAGFYRGPVADALVRLMRRRDGLIRHGDLQAYRAQLVRPLLVRFRGHPVLSMPPPGGGLTLAQLLRLLEPFDLEASGAGSAATLHRLAEAMNLAFRDRNTWLGDPDQSAIPAQALLADTHLAALRARIDPNRHTPARELIPPGMTPPREGVNTTHLSVADRRGGLVALTTTLNFAYGNGVSVPEAGFLLNNEMDDFSLAPGRANAFGLVQGPANAIAPGRRPLSSMAPTLVFRPDGSPWLATGSPGGSRIITTVLQVLLQRLLWGANLATAVAAPRLHSQLLPDQLSLEEGISPDSRRLLEALGHRLSPAAAMGAANSVEVLSPPGSGSLAAMDPRRGRDGALAEEP